MRDRRTARALCAQLRREGYKGAYTRVTDFIRSLVHHSPISLSGPEGLAATSISTYRLLLTDCETSTFCFLNSTLRATLRRFCVHRLLEFREDMKWPQAD